MSQLRNPAFIVTTTERASAKQLDEFAITHQGMKTGDDARYRRYFWELDAIRDPWRRLQGTVAATTDFDGCDSVVRWEDSGAKLAAGLKRQPAWTRRGVAVSLMRTLPVARYEGDAYDSNVGVLVPRDPLHLRALWAFASSTEFNEQVREIDPGLRVVNASLLRVPFDLPRWQAVADEHHPDRLPTPHSDDPTQWFFNGNPNGAVEPLQVAVGRLLGYRWPGQPDADDLEGLADEDGIVCLPSVAGEPSAAERLSRVLARSLGDTWSPDTAERLLKKTGSSKKTIDDWLRDEFFRHHCAVFRSRPFIWHVWDGRRDGFSALVNYHRLDRRTLEKLTYTYLGQDWVERQRAGARDEVAGAEARLVAALGLQRTLEAILTGEKPFDIYVRWKQVYEQSVGWKLDLDDGVRLNIRPFVEAGVLRSPLNVHWKKDRGKEPDGTERHNDLHLSLAEKIDAGERANR